MDIIESQPGAAATNIWSGVDRCKTLARTIKARRAPVWPSPTAPQLPSKDLADSLVDGYLQTSESIYRILHVPLFLREYNAFWELGDKTPNPVFLVQLYLILAIGATTHDDQFSLRPSAVRWVSVAHTWLYTPAIKPRLDLRSIQVELLYLLAQEQVALKGSSTYILAGALLRKAICIGLHRSPRHLKQGVALTAEMRRRLWNTILEITLQSSLTSDGPPLISLDDFDIEAPENLDDDQLVTEEPRPWPMEHFTQASVAILLRQTFPQRLAVVKFLNDLGPSNTHQRAMQLDADLREAYQLLVRRLQSWRPLGRCQLEVRVVDFIMHRYLLSLHIPYFTRAAEFCFSRQEVVRFSLKIWRATFAAPDPAGSSGSSGSSPQSDGDNLLMARLVTCTSGFYPTVAIHAAFLIAQELRMQLQEEGLTSVPLRPDLLSLLDESKAWCLRVIDAGETNIKGFLLMSILTAHVRGLSKDLNKQEMAQLLAEEVGNVVDRCLPILEQWASDLAQQDATKPTGPLGPVDAADTMEDWGFLVSRFGERHFLSRSLLLACCSCLL